MASIVKLDAGWSVLQEEGIRVLERWLETGEALEKSEEGDAAAATSGPTGSVRKYRIFNAAQYSQLYTTVYNMCTQRGEHNWSEELYVRYGGSIEAYIKNEVVPSFRGRDDMALLREMVHRWSNHKIHIKWLEHFFAYLDRYYVKLQACEPLHNKGITIFCEKAFAPEADKVAQALLDAITREREGESVDHALLGGAVDMYMGLGLNLTEVYVTQFEDRLLPATSQYYTRQASGWISTDSFPEYLKKVEDALKSEDARVEAYLHRSTAPKLRTAAIDALLKEPRTQLLEKETAMQYLLQNDKREDLSRMHRLFSSVSDGLTAVAESFRECVKHDGNRIVDEKTQQMLNQQKPDSTDASLVQDIIELHEKFRSVVTTCFESDAVFQKSLKEAFEAITNRDLGKFSFAQLMSSFCDRLLKQSGEKLTEAQVEEGLSRIVDLFSYLTEKDLFADIYRKQLAKRLLQETSASDDAEKSLIAKLKIKCGTNFTSKLEGMLTDLTVAADHQKGFLEWCESQPDPQALVGGIQVSVQVLTTGYWPTYTEKELNLCPPMVKSIAAFEQYYESKTSHRKLKWIHEHGQATVSARFGKRHDLMCTTAQACCLLLFQDDSPLKAEEIIASLKLDETYGRMLLTTLALSRYRPLMRVDTASTSKNIIMTDELVPNASFSCPQRRVKLSAPRQEEAHSKERVEEDRSIAIEAAVVRIMKMRKELQHTQLVSEVLSQLSTFKPNPKSIKHQIEKLIEREYLERKPEDANIYRYLA